MQVPWGRGLPRGARHGQRREGGGWRDAGGADQPVSETVVWDIPEPTQRWLARAAGSLPLVYHEQ